MASCLYSFPNTGAFNAFDKDGDGIIKLNVLEVKPASSSTLPQTLSLKESVRQTRPMVHYAPPNGEGGMRSNRT